MAAVTKNSAERENDNISITALWILTYFEMLIVPHALHRVDCCIFCIYLI